MLILAPNKCHTNKPQYMQNLLINFHKFHLLFIIPYEALQNKELSSDVICLAYSKKNNTLYYTKTTSGESSLINLIFPLALIIMCMVENENIIPVSLTPDSLVKSGKYSRIEFHEIKLNFSQVFGTHIFLLLMFI